VSWQSFVSKRYATSTTGRPSVQGGGAINSERWSPTQRSEAVDWRNFLGEFCQSGNSPSRKPLLASLLIVATSVTCQSLSLQV
jgi:hypothetical protein